VASAAEAAVPSRSTARLGYASRRP
jgi:hypothetical protein